MLRFHRKSPKTPKGERKPKSPPSPKARKTAVDAAAGDAGAQLHASLERQFATGGWRSAYKDLPRLARRMTVGAACASMPPGRELAGAAAAMELADGAGQPVPATAAERPRDEDAAAALRRVIEQTCALLEPERLGEVSAALGEHLPSGRAVDEMATETVLREVLGLASPTALALKMVSQNVIFEGIFLLRTTYQASDVLTLMKDNHSRDGWTVELDVTPQGLVALTHHRRELCGAANAGFVCAWSLRLTFPRSLAELASSTMRIDDVVFDAAAELPQRRDVVAKLLPGQRSPSATSLGCPILLA